MRTDRAAGCREHRIGRANLAAAFPEKSADEIETILRGVWDNLGRVGAEFAHLDRSGIYDPTQPGAGRIDFDPTTRSSASSQLRDDGKPALVFAAHLAQLGAAGARRPPRYGLDTAVLYRRAQHRRGRRRGASTCARRAWAR